MRVCSRHLHASLRFPIYVVGMNDSADLLHFEILTLTNLDSRDALCVDGVNIETGRVVVAAGGDRK